MMMTTTPDDEPTTLEEAFGEAPEEQGLEADDMCRRWAAWTRTRRYFGPPPIAPGILGKLTKKGTGTRRGGPPDVIMSAELQALNLAIAAQPMDTARKVFILTYVHEVSPVKAAADALGISRMTWYRHLKEFRSAVYIAHKSILSENLSARDGLASQIDGGQTVSPE